MPLNFNYIRQPNISGVPVQSAGTVLDARRTVPLAVNVGNGDVYPMNGTTVSNVPTPATIASKKQYVPITGKGNTLSYTEEIVEEARNTSYSRTLLSPPHSEDEHYGKKAMINILYDKQKRGCEFMYFGWQEEKDCDPCTVFLNRWGIGRQTKPITVNPETINWTAPDGSVPLAIMQTVLETSGEMVEYTPLIPYVLEDGFADIDADIDLYTISSYSGNECTSCECPTESFAVGGSQDSPAEAFVTYTTDGGTTFTQISNAVFAVPQVIGKLLDIGKGRLIAIGITSKELAYSDNGAAFVLSTATGLTNIARDAIFTGSKIITVGNGGVVGFSCDRGLTFENQFITVATDPILSASYDSFNNIVWAVDNDDAVFYFAPDATEETLVTTYANPNSSATTKSSVYVLGADHVIVYLDDQTISESYNARSNETWDVQSIGLQTNEDVVAIRGDDYRVVVTTDLGRVLYRDPSTNGVFISIETGGVNSSDFDATDNIRDIYEENDASGNYAQSFFIIVTSQGYVYRLEDCVPCRTTPLC